MSLEQTLEKLVTAIENNTAELVKNREAFVARGPTTAAEVIDKAKTGTVKVDKVEPEKKPETSAATATGTTGESTKAAPADETVSSTTAVSSKSAPADDGLEYQTLAEAILKLVAKDKPKAVAILAEFGAKKGPELKPEQWQACYDKVLAELEPADSLA